ncbi:MAG: DegT/DnrJ/EryC1/StrS family aminotransferase [Candidatus Marinimicrobia bacterium]|nr:DegT/DnrJ/EryC1/StrS family aminotransferase [Candidatus Neomarinimicrobiota bacterium]
MKVPLLDLRFQNEPIRDQLLEKITKIVDSCRYILGPEVEEFEKEIANYCEAKYAIGVSSGSDALLVSLMALDVGHGDIVITSNYSFFATAGVIARLSATPVFIDVEKDTFNIDPEKLKEWFEKNSDKIKKVKAIIVVHLFGQCCKMDEVLDIASEYGIPVIEDAAQSIGARYPSKYGIRRAGSIGLIGCFSFFPSKNLGCMGDGGLVTTNDGDLADRIKKLRNHGAHPKYYHTMVGGNFRLDEIQAGILRIKLKKLDEWHRIRQENAKYYNEKFKNSCIRTPTVVYDFSFHIFNQYVIVVPDRRDELKDYLLNNKIGCEIYYPIPFHLQECFKYLGYREGDFPVSEYLAKHSLAIPIFPGLTREQQNYIVEKIYEFYDN